MFFARPAALLFAASLLCCLTMPGGPAPAAQNQSEKLPATEAGADSGSPPLTGYIGLLIDNIPAKQCYLRTYWQRILDEHDPEAAFGGGQKDLPSHHLEQWKNLSARMSDPDTMKRLRYINGFFNNFPSRSDQELYGREDYWATPEEFMANRAGDCEDYAVAKYLALRYFGWPAKNM
ncbi:transglutaminase-like cysteine peptidase, partial [Desulfovibrio sp. OttesenSCG-928-G11]|nr:transglutaminase-like cysteine peptidase [Desulfovibrio sp. OttesenSCG-928-G11]